jgi:hypothetical protein
MKRQAVPPPLAAGRYVRPRRIPTDEIGLPKRTDEHALFDVDEVLDLQPFGFRVVSLDRYLRVAVTEKAGHLGVWQRFGSEFSTSLI